jgi:two-component system CheB/CheR fusion protein
MSPRAPRVLVVDDDPRMVDAMRRLLRLEGIDAVGAGDGQEALDALDAATFDLVLCDVRMPAMDGPTALRTAKARGGAVPPWVFLTGYADSADTSLLELGASAVYGKPVDVETLLDLIATWARRRADG